MRPQRTHRPHALPHLFQHQRIVVDKQDFLWLQYRSFPCQLGEQRGNHSVFVRMKLHLGVDKVLGQAEQVEDGKDQICAVPAAQ